MNLTFSHNLLIAIRRIAKNDVNKKSLVTQGSLPVLVSLINSEYEDEQIGKHKRIIEFFKKILHASLTLIPVKAATKVRIFCHCFKELKNDKNIYCTDVLIFNRWLFH